MFYIVKDDAIGRELQSKLIQKARESVKVYFLYDEIGSHKLPRSYLRDMQIAAIGTANLDNRSFRLNFEITLLNYDPGFVKEVADMLAGDFSRSRPVSMEEYSEGSFFFKLAVRSARLLAPIL